MNLFTNRSYCSWSCLRISKIRSGGCRQAGVQRRATDGCLGGLAPSGEEAGERVHEAAVTFLFLMQHVYIFVLDQRCCSSSAAASAGGSAPAGGVLRALARVCTRGSCPGPALRGEVRWKREGRSKAVAANWGSGCMRLPRELWESPGKVLHGAGTKGPWLREGEEGDLLLPSVGLC